MKFINKEFIKFLIVGVINTFSSYVIYLMFITFMTYNVSYTLSYFCGIVISYILNSVFVFKVNLTLKNAFKFPLVYIVQYLLNIILLNVFVKYTIINEVFAPILIIIISVPLTFVLSKIILKK